MMRTGRFVNLGDTVVLVDDYGNRWRSERVGIVQGGWGYDQDGVARLPRPWRYDTATGDPIVRGDVVLITFLHNNTRQPVVLAGLRRVGSSDGFLDTRFAEQGAEQVRSQLRVQDPDTGAVRGAVRLQAGPNDGTVEVTVLDADETTVRAVVTIGPDEVEVRGQRVTLGTPGGIGAEPLIKGGTYLDDENTSAIQELPVFAAAAAFFGLPFDQISARAAKLTAAASGTGEPYLSTTSETE